MLPITTAATKTSQEAWKMRCTSTGVSPQSYTRARSRVTSLAHAADLLRVRRGLARNTSRIQFLPAWLTLLWYQPQILTPILGVREKRNRLPHVEEPVPTTSGRAATT